jgi:chorismate dehydratase
MTKLKIGAVTYLNAKPLIRELPRFLPEAQLTIDYPSRLAELLETDELDVALVPVMAFLRHKEKYTILSDAAIACDGPVLSVRLYFRVPLDEVKTVSLDSGSRTSAALTKILLARKLKHPVEYAPFPLGHSIDQCEADAVMMIGDRAIEPVEGPWVDVWDLGQLWKEETGLPMVFAMWIARKELRNQGQLAKQFAAARDAGVEQLATIAEQESAPLRIDQETCLTYLRDHLTYRLGPRELSGLQRFALEANHLGLL